MWSRALKLALLVLLLAGPGTTVSGGVQDANRTLGDEIQSNLWCPCGCNQVLGACNHIGCPSGPAMRLEVQDYLDAGYDKENILALFEEKYGETILTAPSTEGWFNLSAWLMPFVGLVVGAGGVVVLTRRFRQRGMAPREDAVNAQTTSAYDQRIEDDLSEFTPED